MTAITPQMVVDHYSTLAREDGTKNNEHIKKVAESFGYAPEDLAGIPEGANLGVSCGNPLAVAGLKPGETVLDLGSGAGFDVFQAARRIGPIGLAIGVDLSSSMLSRARANAAKSGIKNVKFVLAPITAIPLESESVDCVISNCVINLLPVEEKGVCFREIARVLRKGGRVAVSDILAKKRMPEELRADLGLYVGCVSGASEVGEYEGWLRGAGFEDIMIVDKKSDLNIYKERVQEEDGDSCCAPKETTSCCGTAELSSGQKEKEESAKRVEGIDFNEWVSSYSIYAVKPLGTSQA